MIESIIDIINNICANYPDIDQECSSLSPNFNLPLNKEFQTLSHCIPVSRTIQNSRYWDTISFEKKFILSKYLGHFKMITNTVYNAKLEVTRLVKETHKMHDNFHRIARLNNFIMSQNDSQAYRHFITFINRFSYETKLHALKCIICSGFPIFYFKYFQQISSNDLGEIFSFNFKNLSSSEKVNFCFFFHDFLVLMERFELARKILFILSSNIIELNDKLQLIVLYRSIIRLMRMQTVRSVNSEYEYLKIDAANFYKDKLNHGNINILELKFYLAYHLSMASNETMKHQTQFIKPLQHHVNQFCSFNIMKKLTTYHQMSTIFDNDFCWKWSLFFTQYTCKHFHQYSPHFVVALKRLIKMYMGLGMSTRKLAEQAVGLCEMIYFSHSRLLLSAQLLLSKSIHHEYILINVPVSGSDHDLVASYKINSLNIAQQIEFTFKTKLKCLLWFLQITSKYTPEGQFHLEYQDYYNESCLLISQFESVNMHLFELYREHLHFVDSLVTGIYQKNYGGLTKFHLMLLNTYHTIEEQDSLIARKLKCMCRYSPLVAKYANDNGLTDTSERYSPPSRIHYSMLVKKPELDFLYESGLWTRPVKEILNQALSSGTEDSDSDSMSDCSTNSYKINDIL